MAEFPPAPISPADFFESFLPGAFAEGEVADDIREVEARIGVRLDGEGGGEWVFHLERGAFRVEAAPRDETSFTVVQSVEDWRGALWEGRGGAIGKQAASLFRPGQTAVAGAMGGAPSPASLDKLAALDGVIRMQVTGGDGGDWRVDFKLGPGAIPDEPTTTLTLTSDDAAAMERGELDPLQAFMAGRIQVAGDMALVMQMQAIQMQAAMEASARSGGS